MLFTSTVIAQASGSLGGLVFSHNAGGPYIRTRATPINPNTPEQATVRGFLSQLTALWVETLTQAERDAWTLYAENVPLINRIGQSRNVTGLNMYVRSNVPLLQAGFARQDAAPTLFTLGGFTIPQVAALAATQEISVLFTITDDWVNEDDAGMLIYASRPQNESINFFTGPYRFAGSIDGDSVLPPPTPQMVGLPFAAVIGQKIFVRLQVVRADGRLSADTRLDTIVIA